MADPFADLIPQGGSEQGGIIDLPASPRPTPVTQYSIPRRVLGGSQGDEMYDSGTARGVGSSENELTPGVVAVNPSVYPIGTIFKDGDTNEVFVAGDKHGNKNPNVIDIYTPPSQYTGSSGSRNIVPIGRIPSNQVPKTASGVGELLANYGKVPQGEGAYTSLGNAQSQQEDPFADLIPQQQGANATAQPKTQEQTADPFSDLIPQQQGQDQAQPSSTPIVPISSTTTATHTGIQAPQEQPEIATETPYDWKGAAIAAGSTAVEQGAGLLAGPSVARAISTAVPIPIVGPALGMAGMVGVQQATEYGIKKLEEFAGYRQQIEEAQQAHPTVSTVTGYATMAPFAITSLKNIGADFAKTLSTDGATAAAKQLAGKLVGGAIGGSLLGPIRYGLENLEKVTGIRKEEPTPITGREELENGIIGLILSGHAEAEKTNKQLGGPAPEVAPSTNPNVNKKEAEILASADAQAPVPEVTIIPEPIATAKAPAADLNALIAEQLFHDEGSLEYKAIQDQIDSLKQPAEAPVAEAQPEIPNAVQENLTQAQGGVGLGNAQPNANQNIVPERSQEEQRINREATPDNVAATQGGISQASDAWLKGIEGNDPQAVANAEKELSRTKEGVQELQRLKVLADYDNARLSLRASGDYGTSARQAATQERTRSSQERGRVGQPSGELAGGEQRGTQETSLTNAEKEYLAKRQKIIDADAAFIKGEISKEEWESKNNTFKKIRRDFLNSLPNETEGQFLERVRLSQEQPTEKTYESVQIENAGEVGIRNAPAVGEGMGAENKPEVPSTEGEAPKEKVKPQEVQLTDEQQAEKVLLDKIDAEAGKPKTPKPKAPELNPYNEILRRYESGEEDSINNSRDLVDEIGKVARKQRNQYLKDAIDNFHEAMDIGADVEPEIDKLLNEVKREGERFKAPKQKKEPKIKTAKDKAREVFGDAADKLTYVLENKILDPVQYKKMVKAGVIEKGGEYDFFYNAKLPKKVRDLIFSRDGNPIDVISDVMGKTPDELLIEIQEAYLSAERTNEQAVARDKQQKALEEQALKMEQLKKTNPQEYERIAEEEARKLLNSRLGREGGFFEFPDFVKDAAIKAGDAIRKSVKSFKDWSNGMIARFGEGIRGFLKDIWASVRDNWNKDIGGGSDTGGRSREQAQREAEAKYAPKPPTEQEVFAKKAADAFLKGRGTPITEEELSSVLARKFPGISQGEISDLFATASGKPKPSAPYAGVAAGQETPEQISIRKKDQADQVKRGILTSVIDTAQGLSDANLIERGRKNLANGVDPNQALEQARQGEPEALSTARAYFETVLAPRASEALKTKGPKSPEYIKASKEATDYYQGIREGLSAASEALRTAKGQVDLTDASAIAREYTIQTGEEPTLSQHEKIRKIADKVDTTIKELDKASEEHRTAMDDGLSDIEVQTPESVEEGRQQVADLSDAQGKKAKNEIDRLNNELEQTKKDLEEVRQAKATGQDAESLKAYYEAKLKDLENQLKAQPKYGKEVFEQARKIVDRWKADAAEAEKLLSKQLSQMGSSPDPTIIATLARIMRAHIGELALDFTESSARLVAKFGPKIKPFLKEAWAKAQELIKGEAGGEKAVKTAGKAKAKAKTKPVDKITPAEKAEDSLRKRIAQAQKKIDDLNSGKITTPKDVEKVTSDEINRLEAEYNQKKKELADVRLKSKQKQLFEKGNVGDELNPEQVKTLWESAKRFYLDKGESDYDKMISDIASDFGLTPEQVRKAFATPKGAKKASDEMYKKQRNRQMALDEAKRWLDEQKASWIGKVFGTAAEKTFKLAIFGHGTAFIGTHAPTTLYTHPRAAFKAWLKGLSYSFRGKNGRIQNIVDNKDLINRPNWIVARKSGLENDPREIRREGATPARSDSKLAKALDTLSGGRGFDALFHLRQDIFDQAWNQLSVTQRTPEMAEMLSNSINNATGFTKGGKRTAGLLQSPITKILFFAPKLIASRFKWLIQDPARMLGTFAKMANPFTKVSPEERMSAIYEAKNKAKFLGVLTGSLLANQALLFAVGSNQSINFTDPKKNDWLAYKGFGYQLSTIGSMTRIARLLASEYNAVFGELSRWQKAKGGREQAMKDALYTYLRSGFSPITRDIIVGATGKDYVGNTVPWSSQQPDRGRRKLTWGELMQEQFAPIPLSEAATQKETLPAALKAGSAAFLGTRLETPADVEEYQKSLQARPKRSSSGLAGGLGKGL